MLVIGIEPGAGAGDAITWRGRRHDDDGPGASQGDTAAGLFDAVFHALHDGEQVAVGFPAPLSVPAPADADVAASARAALGEAVTASPAVAAADTLLGELGKWRPWTVVSTSLPRWRATTSVLVWESPADGAGMDAAVEAFYDLVRARADHGAEATDTAVLNLAAAAALTAELTVDAAQLGEPVLAVPARAATAAN